MRQQVEVCQRGLGLEVGGGGGSSVRGVNLTEATTTFYPDDGDDQSTNSEDSYKTLVGGLSKDFFERIQLNGECPNRTF